MEESDIWANMAKDILPEHYRCYVNIVVSETVEDYFSLFRGMRYKNLPDLAYDFVFIDDVVNAFLSVPMNPSQINGKHFLVGSGEGKSILEAAKMVAERAREKRKVNVSIKHMDPPTNLSSIESRNFIADCSRLKQATGWVPRYSIKKGIDLTLKKYSSSMKK